MGVEISAHPAAAVVVDDQRARRSIACPVQAAIVGDVCVKGARFANASEAELAALRQAFIPVYASFEQDPQTNTKAKQPELYVKDGQLSGDLSAYAAAWNGQHFNQGSPKPGGQRPGLTTGPTGTYDSKANYN